MQNYSDRTDPISSVADYLTVRFGTEPVKCDCPKVSTGPKIDQQLTPLLDVDGGISSVLLPEMAEELRSTTTLSKTA